MASEMSLTKVASFARKAIYGVLIGFVVLAVTTYVMRQIQDYQRLHPPKVVKRPNYLFSKLPELVFPENNQKVDKVTLQIASGFFPETPNLVKVFAVKPQKFPGFDPVVTARNFVVRLGFSSNEKKINEKEYEFVGNTDSLKKIKVNVVLKSFDLTSDLKSGFGFIMANDLPTPGDAILFSKSSLRGNNLWVPSENAPEPLIFYYKITPKGDLMKTELPFDANLIRVVFNREKIDEKTVFVSNEETGQADLLLASGKDNSTQIIEFKYHYFPIDEVNFGTYYTKSASQAWEEFKAGKGYVENFGLLKDPIVRSVFLGFYDSLLGSGYIYPIWVFEGDKGFRAFVSAVLPK